MVNMVEASSAVVEGKPLKKVAMFRWSGRAVPYFLDGATGVVHAVGRCRISILENLAWLDPTSICRWAYQNIKEIKYKIIYQGHATI